MGHATWRHGRTMGENMKLIHDPLMGNMDGEPYDQLIDAARYIKQLEDRISLLKVVVRELGGEA